MAAQLDHVQQVCAKAVEQLHQVYSDAANHVSSVSGQIGHALPESQSVRNFDQSMNLIIFGVDENRDPNIWHTTVNDIFNGLAGRSVDTVDVSSWSLL